MSKLRIRSMYDYDRDPGIDFTGDPGVTKQSFRDECDIRSLVEKYEQTGQLPNMIAKDPMWGDFSDLPSYQESLNIVIKAQEQFMALPAHVRDRFANEPAHFLEFMGDPKNADEIVRLGLAKAPESSNSVSAGLPEGGARSPSGDDSSQAKGGA